MLHDKLWCLKWAYSSDLFEILNMLKFNMQEKKNIFLHLRDI